ncbi:MAG: methyl-accepting chemotaxis protein, partial [Vibrio anguillarum]
MNSSINNRHSLSLLQTISAIFITMTLLVVLLSITSLKSIDKVGLQFSGLSEQTLPLALNNARLTQNILEQVQSLGDGIRTTESAELEAVNQQLSHLNQQTDQLTDQLFSIATRIGNAITQDHQVSLRSKSAAFQQLTYSILSTQASLLEQQNAIDNAATAFRYGLSSIGPEMNRISSFLALDNPESMDAANRFIASASSMESTFLLLMMQNDPEQAKVQFKEIRNRMAGIE